VYQKNETLLIYIELLDQLQLPTLANRKMHMRFCYMHKIIRGLLYFPPDVICPRVTMSHNTHSHLYIVPTLCTY